MNKKISKNHLELARRLSEIYKGEMNFIAYPKELQVYFLGKFWFSIDWKTKEIFIASRLQTFDDICWIHDIIKYIP